MKLTDLIRLTTQEFMEERKAVVGTTRFRELSNWSSLNALIYISSIHDQFGVLLSSEDLSKSNTIEDIFDIIQKKQ
ncbi:acyl carrier protein [Vicingaceae bacterium]|nr:acyl carrier protein [Vicingaceae bacterium]